MQLKPMIKHYKRGWGTVKNFTSFAKQLSTEQKRLHNDNSIIPDTDKKQPLMIEVCDRNLFDRRVMIEWNEQPTIQKDYSSAVTYFTKHLAAIISFEAAICGVQNKQGYKSTNTATKFQIACVAEIKANKATTEKETKVMATAFMGAISEQQAEIKSVRGILVDIKNKISTREPMLPEWQRRQGEEKTPPRRSRRHHYKSNLEMEGESPPNSM